MRRRTPRSTIFLFKSYGDPQDLHSFPTRRSSDLSPTVHQPTSAGMRPVWRTTQSVRCPAVNQTTPVARNQNAASRPTSSTARSEEHTSELQSRQYLVCRLLLE